MSSVKLHCSHCKGTRKQFLLRIILAQCPCHRGIKAFPGILTIAVCRRTIITLLLDFTFEVLILGEDLIRTFDQRSFLFERNFRFGYVICFPFRFFIQLANGAHVMWFSLGLPVITRRVLKKINKTIVPFAPVGYEMVIANSALRWLFTISYHGIIVK